MFTLIAFRFKRDEGAGKDKGMGSFREILKSTRVKNCYKAGKEINDEGCKKVVKTL